MVNFNPTPEDLERARARLGLSGGVQTAQSPRTFGFESVPEDDGNFLQDVLGFIAEADRPLAERAGIDVGGPIGFIIDELTRPSTLAIALGGAGLAARAASLTGRGAGTARAISGFVAPRGTNFATRLASTTAESVGARAASEAANDLLEGAHPAIRISAALAGGIAGGAGAAGALSSGARQAVGRDLFALPDLSTGARIAAQPARQVERIGEGTLLQAPTVGSMVNARVDEIIPHGTFNLRGRSVAENLGRQVEAQSERVVAIGSNALRRLGRTFEGDDGNVYVSGVTRTDGTPAPLQEVLEYGRQRFKLTDDQVKAVEEFQSAFRQVKNTADTFGYKIDDAELEPGQGFVSRKRKPETKREAAQNRSGGPALAVRGQKSREYRDPAEAIAAGVVYEHPLVALERYAKNGLSNSANLHIASLLKPFSETSSLRVSPALRAQHDGLVNSLRSLKATHGRLDERLKNTVDAYINAAEPNLDELLVELDNLKVVDPADLPDVWQEYQREIRRLASEVGVRVTRRGDVDDDARGVISRAMARKGGQPLPTYREFQQSVAETRRTARSSGDALLDDLSQIRVRGSGRNAGRNADEIAAEIDRVKAEIKALRPEWKRALDRSKRIPAGRTTIPVNIAPALAGRDFAEDVGQRITSYYSRGKTPQNALGTAVRKLNRVNRAIVPMRAMGDMSAVLNQLAAILPTNPVIFTRNLFRALGDVAKPELYERYLIQHGQDAAQHGVVVLGRVADQADFQFPTWFHRVPGIRGLQRHFEAVTTRNRIDIYNQYVDIAAKRGTPLDDVSKEEIARSLNRLSGISNSRANDLETLVEFAPNFLRSSLEVVASAVRDGNLEGQIARQYVRNLVIAGQLMTVAAATGAIPGVEKRDFRDVLSPIDIRAARRGELRMNSNFGTIRIAGQDVSVYGRFDSLARLAVVGMDAGAQFLATGDAMELADFIGEFARSKGSPFVGFTGDLIQGSTFSGNDPVSLSAAAEYALPFTVQAFIQDASTTENLPATVAGGFWSFFGGKSNPLTAFEQFNEASLQRFGRPLDELTGQERQALEEALPGLAERSKRDTERRANQGDARAQARTEFEEITERRISSERELMQAHQVGEIDAQQLGNALSELQFRAAVERDQVMRTLDVEFNDPNDPAKLALDAWFNTFDESEIAPGVKDWELRDALEADLFARIAAGEFGDPARAMAHITDRRETQHAAEVQWYYDAKDVINGAGYYELQDSVYAQFADAASRFAGGQLSTYGDLVRMLNVAERNGDIRMARGLATIRNRIDAVVQRQRKALRVRNPELDAALVQSRGLTPVRPLSLAAQ